MTGGNHRDFIRRLKQSGCETVERVCERPELNEETRRRTRTGFSESGTASYLVSLTDSHEDTSNGEWHTWNVYISVIVVVSVAVTGTGREKRGLGQQRGGLFQNMSDCTFNI